MKLNFIKVNPTENMTIFILDPLPRSMYPEVANKLMNYNNLHAEQVGFIERPNLPESCSRLHMMGGEFCGNASRAFAAIMVQRGYSSFELENDKYIVPFEASGVEQILYGEVRQLTDNSFEVKVKIPLHKSISSVEINYNGIDYKGFIVEFDGIAHAVISTGNDLPGEGLLLKLVEELSPLSYSALGIMFYNEEKDFITPLVYVKDTGSIIWERGCGTGTAALGVVLSLKSHNSIDKKVNQPGGTIDVLTNVRNGQIEDIYLKGDVTIVAEGEVYI
ncbi:diaminopimelate epimerase [Clostridium sp. PL3]|uniref:Diaminopimelate epimerase n=1 Tax=Clostridium thailandense TaxID=2794346 RepID=A0A949WS24_9CLOT|nr:diaminopimelate epimerase [Clostridium thailandense]MBV7274626.1 diaminopimelate epimerase [Clostridium thailandense]